MNRNLHSEFFGEILLLLFLSRLRIEGADSVGNLAAFPRKLGAFMHSIDIAIDRVYTAASFGLTISKWHEASQQHSLKAWCGGYVVSALAEVYSSSKLMHKTSEYVK